MIVSPNKNFEYFFEIRKSLIRSLKQKKTTRFIQGIQFESQDKSQKNAMFRSFCEIFVAKNRMQYLTVG